MLKIGIDEKDESHLEDIQSRFLPNQEDQEPKRPYELIRLSRNSPRSDGDAVFSLIGEPTEMEPDESLEEEVDSDQSWFSPQSSLQLPPLVDDSRGGEGRKKREEEKSVRDELLELTLPLREGCLSRQNLVSSFRVKQVGIGGRGRTLGRPRAATTDEERPCLNVQGPDRHVPLIRPRPVQPWRHPQPRASL